MAILELIKILHILIFLRTLIKNGNLFSHLVFDLMNSKRVRMWLSFSYFHQNLEKINYASTFAILNNIFSI